MTGKLREAIGVANSRAGKERQKVFAKKAYLKQTDAQVIDMLCARAEEVVAAFPAKFAALAQAVAVARKHLEKK
jgi:hypothetical protein